MQQTKCIRRQPQRPDGKLPCFKNDRIMSPASREEIKSTEEKKIVIRLFLHCTKFQKVVRLRG